MRLRSGVITAAGVGAGLAAWAVLRKAREADISGQVVFITGGSRGLGLQLARSFGEEGCTLVLCARDADELDRARADLQSRGVTVHTMTCDVAKRDQVTDAIADAMARFGRIDILVNNAGVIEVGPVETMTVEDFENAMNVMFWGTLYTTLAVLPGMRQRQAGRIVNITSIGGKVSVPHLIPYSCAKFAAVALSEGLRSELSGEGIQILTVVPGLMRTGSHVNARFKGDAAKEFVWFSMGAASPLVSISAQRAARSIVASTKRGDAERILSFPAGLLARLHGAFPELVAPVLGLIDRLLPKSDGSSGSVGGREAEEQLDSQLHRALTSMGRSAGRDLNERVPEA